MIVLNHLAITMLLGAPWAKTLTCLDLPLTTLMWRFKVAAELMGLESTELEVCLSSWHAEMAQLLLWRDAQARIGTVHVWTSELFHLLDLFSYSTIYYLQVHVSHGVVCNYSCGLNTDVQHALGNMSYRVTCRMSSFPRPFALWPLCIPRFGVKQTFPKCNTPSWPLRFQDLVGIGKSA